MLELVEMVGRIKAIIQVIEQAGLPAGISIEGCRNVRAVGNLLVNCGISVRDSEDIVVFANRIDDRRRMEILNLLYELVDLLTQQPRNKNRIIEILNRIRQIAEPIYYVLASIDMIQSILGSQQLV